MEINFYKGKKVLVTGGTGLIGIPLVEKLLSHGASVTVVSLDDESRCPDGAAFLQLDLTQFENCKKACEGQDIVFHLAGIKGSPLMCSHKPASFFYSTIAFNTHMLEAAYRAGVKRYLFTSSIGVYSPQETFHEDDVWTTFPSPHDKFAGWAKRMGELQVEAYRIQYNWDHIYIVRPANVYGPWDNFDPQNAMVVPSLIQRIFEGESPLHCWGDGSAVRDFIFSEDVADDMIRILLSDERRPVNLGSGEGVTIKELAETLVKIIDPQLKIHWDLSKPSGDKVRLMDTSRAQSLHIKKRTSLIKGLEKTINWYQENKLQVNKRYNVFNS